MKVKRILSSIMAAVMVATSLVAVNVSNVWAADSQQLVDSTVTINFADQTEPSYSSISGTEFTKDVHYDNGISLYSKSGNALKAYALATNKYVLYDSVTYKGYLDTAGNPKQSRAVGFRLNRAATVKVVYAAKSSNRSLLLCTGLPGTSNDAATANDSNVLKSIAYEDSSVKDVTFQITNDNITDKVNGTLFTVTGTNGYRLYSITVTPEAKTATADKYTWAVSVPESLKGIDKTEISFGSASTYGDATNTIEYTGTKYDKTPSFPTEIKTTDTFVETKQGAQIGTSDFYNYTATVTLQDSWFEEKPSYAVSGTVYDSATVQPLAGATVTSTASSAIATTGPDGKFTIEENIGNANLTYTATGYTAKTIEYTAATADAVIDLVPKTINDSTTTLTANKFYARSPYTAYSTDNIDSLTDYSVNGFTFAGGTKLQVVDSKGNSTGSDGYVGRVNVSASDSSKGVISFTPSEAGTLTVTAKTGSSDGSDRKAIIEQGTSTTTIPLKDGAMHTDSLAVVAGTACTITADTGAVNIYEATFTPAPVEEPAFKILTIAPTNVIPGDFVIIGQFDENKDVEDYELVGIKVGKTKECDNQLVTSENLYNTVIVDGRATPYPGKSVFAVLVRGVTKADSKDNRIYAMGYSRKVGSTVGTYSTYSSAEIEKSTETSTTEPTA